MAAFDFAQNPYFDPKSGYGSNQDWLSTPIIGGPTGYLESNPYALHTRKFGGANLAETGFGRYADRQFQQLRRAYEAAFAANPNLTNQQFLQPFDVNTLRRQYLMQDPITRGARYGQAVPRARWIGGG